MSKYIIETATALERRTNGDAETLNAARAKCFAIMSLAKAEGGPDFAFAIDEGGHYAVALERTSDGRILDHLLPSPDSQAALHRGIHQWGR